MKKVLFVVESFGSGVFNFLVDLINGIDNEFEVLVAYGVRKETLENFKVYFNKNVKFIQVKNFTRSINLSKDFKAWKEIKKIVKKEKPDIVHLHSSKAGILGRLAVNGNKIKMFYNPHGFSFLKKDDSILKRGMYWNIEKFVAMVNKNCIIVGCSKGEFEEAKKLNRRAICINNGIDIKKMLTETKDIQTKDIDYENIKICTIGRIGYQKNPELFNEIAKKFPNIQFTWIGEGELKEKLTGSNILITGWKERRDVLQILNDNDIFVLTSLWEGLPLSLLEAMYMKKICIVSNCIGNRDVIKNRKNGYISNGLEDFIENIKKVITNKEQNDMIISNAYDDVVNNYNIEIMTEKYRKEYLK